MTKTVKKLILIFLVGFLISVGFFAFTTKNDKLFAIAKNIDIFATLVRELDSYYVDEIDPDKLVTIGIDAMLKNWILTQNIFQKRIQMILGCLLQANMLESVH